MKEEIVEETCKDGIAIECISTPLLKARISIKSNLVTFVVAYAPTEEAPGGRRPNNSSPQQHRRISSRLGTRLCFNRRKRQGRKERRGKRGSRQQGVGLILPRHAQRKRQTTAGFHRTQQARSSGHIFCTPNEGVPYTFQSVNKGQERLDYILTKKTDRRLVRCVNVRRLPFEGLETDHNLVYAKVRIPRRSGRIRRKGGSTKGTPKTANLRRLMADPNLQCQVLNAMVAALPPIPDDTCINDRHRHQHGRRHALHCSRTGTARRDHLHGA